MTYLSIENTKAVMMKLRRDLAKIILVTDLVTQIIFLIYYVYLSVISVHQTVHHIIYSLFLIIGIGMFVFNLVSRKLKINKFRKRFIKRIVRYAKYPARISLIAISMVELIQNGGTTTNKMMTALSIVFLVIQIVMNLIVRFITSYIDYFEESLKMDYEDSDLIRAIVNSRKNQSDKKQGFFMGKVKSIAKSKLDEFIEDNKDLEPIPIPSTNQNKIRKKIASFSKKEEILELDDIDNSIAQ